MEFRFSAGELFLLVDEKKIKRRFISFIHDFLYLGERAGPLGLLRGQYRMGRMANVLPSLQSLFPLGIDLS